MIIPLRHELDELPNALGSALRHHQIVAAAVATEQHCRKEKDTDKRKEG